MYYFYRSAGPEVCEACVCSRADKNDATQRFRAASPGLPHSLQSQTPPVILANSQDALP